MASIPLIVAFGVLLYQTLCLAGGPLLSACGSMFLAVGGMLAATPAAAENGGKIGPPLETVKEFGDDFRLVGIGVSAEGETFNINADTVAGALAGALKAKRLLLLTDVQGVIGTGGELIRQMTVQEAGKAVATGVASGGMIPKLETAVAAVEAGVESAVILDGRRPHAMLVELFTEHGAGTLVRA